MCSDQSHIALDSLALPLGRVAIAWGRLQEELAHVFSAIVVDGITDVALAAWHCHKSDRAQRDMLEAVSKEGLAVRPKLCELIVYLVSQINNMANFRNDIIHASYAYYLPETGEMTMIPYAYHGNRRSEQIDKKYLEGSLPNVLLAFESQIVEITKLVAESYQCVVDAQRITPPTPGKWLDPAPEHFRAAEKGF